MKANDWRRSYLQLIVVFLLLMASCKSNNMKIEDIPIPSGATRGVSDMSYRTATRTDANTKLIDIKERFGKFDSEISTFNQPTNWQEIGRFYDAELAKYDYVRKTNIPSEAIDADVIFYESSKSGGKIAVSLFEAVNGSDKTPRQFLLLVVSK